MLKSVIQSVIRLSGYELINKSTLARLRQSEYRGIAAADSMQDSLSRLSAAGIVPELIIDIGAAKGKWTEKAMEIWHDSEYILIEPLEEQLKQVNSTLRESEKVKLVESVAGNTEGKISFNVSADLDGSGVYGSSESSRYVPVVKVDSFTEKFNSGILIKLDTHGFEIPVFEGAEKTLEKAVAIIVEVYGFHVSPTALLFHEISDYLYKKGFRLYDIVDILRRDSDQAFWQADAIYLRKSNEVFVSNAYKK